LANRIVHRRSRLRLRHLRPPLQVDSKIVWTKLASLAEGARLAS
jgi:hypothetical protein